MKRIGLYGGTFNPPHVGHIRAAKAAFAALGLDALVLIPDRIAPHKTLPPNSPNPEQRLRMLEIAAEGCEGFRVSDLELCREGISYSYETVLELKKQYPGDQLVLLMGSDMFLTFAGWVHPEIILANASLGVFCRGDKGEKSAVAEEKPGWKPMEQAFTWWTTSLCPSPPPSFAVCWPSDVQKNSCRRGLGTTSGKTACMIPPPIGKTFPWRSWNRWW